MDAAALKPGLSFVRTEYGGAILDMRRGEYWRLNPVGAEVFAALAAGDVDPVAAVTDRFEVEVSVARRDANELIDQLREIGMVVP